MYPVVYQARAVSGRGKLSGAPEGVNSAARWGTAGLLAIIVLVAACTTPRTIRELPAGRWTAPLGDVRNASFLTERVPEMVEVKWQRGLGRGLPAAPIVQGDLIIAVIAGGGIVTASADDGQRYWSRRFSGAIAGQPVRVDDRVYFATFHRAGTVYALDLHRGRRQWSHRVGGRAAAGIAWADGLLFVPTDRGELLALQAHDGSVVWRVSLGAVAAQAPLVLGDELVIATTRDTVLRVARQNGGVRARLPLPGMATAPLAAAGDTLIIAMAPGMVAAFAERGARELWRHELDAPVLAAPVAAPDGVYALNRRAELFRLTPTESVRIAEVGGATTESLTVAANGFVIGRLDGTVVFVDREGRVQWQQRVDGSVRAPAAVSGGSVYVSTLAGRLARLAP